MNDEKKSFDPHIWSGMTIMIHEMLILHLVSAMILVIPGLVNVAT